MTLKPSALLRTLLAVAAAALVLPIANTARPAFATTNPDGIVRVESAYGFDETIVRLRDDIAKKGIKFFIAVDQTQLGASAGIKLKPSTLLIFGNPPLGIQFLTSNPDSGLDWPVRLLVRQDESGHVWAVYTDFGWIAKRHGITDRAAQFKMASDVIASITSSISLKQ
jgi:uncharacterized protein (DUF302 family)